MSAGAWETGALPEADGSAMRPAGLKEVLAFFYRPRGRIGRGEYALGLALVYAISLAVLAFAVTHPEILELTLALAMWLAIPLTIGFLVVVAKRCHDIGLPGSFVIAPVRAGRRSLLADRALLHPRQRDAESLRGAAFVPAGLTGWVRNR